MNTSVFKNIKVVEFTIFGIGPLAGKLLADFGARVIRVESVDRPDPTRLFPAYKDGEPGVNRSLFWANQNTSKLSMALNLNHPQAIQSPRTVKWADVVIENFRPGVFEKWGSHMSDAGNQPPGYSGPVSNMGHRDLTVGREERAAPCNHWPVLHM
jgi:benzylsuccinate CoA-transferase BbsF subunit